MTRPREERTLYLLLILIGLLVLVPIVAGGSYAGAGFTMGFAMSALGVLGLCCDLQRWSRKRPTDLAHAREVVRQPRGH
jgi:hypothetical protein